MYANRFEYSQEQENAIRKTEIMAILENDLYEDEDEEKDLLAELDLLLKDTQNIDMM